MSSYYQSLVLADRARAYDAIQAAIAAGLPQAFNPVDARRAMIVERFANEAPTFEAEPAPQVETALTRPFRFEDLQGKPEPEKWGPLYPKTASAAVEKWRALGRVRELTPDEKRQHGRAVGEWIRALNNPAVKRHEIPASDLKYRLTCAAIRGRCRAAFAAAANAERRAWADGKPRPGTKWTIRDEYKAAMAAKAARIAREALPAAA